jgi:uncharacterized protein YukE
MSDVASVIGAGAQADTGAIRTLAARLGQVAADVGSIRSRLRDGDTSGTWTGSASHTFRATLAAVDPDLARLATSHDGARRALTTYADAVEDLQRRAAAAAAEQNRARRGQTTADTDHRAASNALSRAQHAESAAHDPIAQSEARRATAAARGSLDAATARQRTTRDDVTVADAAARALRDRFAEAERACVAALDDAAHSGLYTSSFAHAMHHIGHALTPVGQTLAFAGGLVAKTVVNAVLLPEDIAQAFGNALTGHGHLEDFGQVLDDLGAIVTIIGVGAAVVGTGGVAAAVGLGAIGVGLNGAKFGIDAQLVDRGELPRERLLIDGAGIAVGAGGVGAGMLAARGAEHVASGVTAGVLERPLVTSRAADAALSGTETIVTSADEELAQRLVTPTHESPWDQAVGRVRDAITPPRRTDGGLGR